MDKYTALREYFGFSAFRPGQEALIDAILSGRDAFGVMPTGGGKSVCYQLPAMLLEGLTLVVSPLISLMKDQVAALQDAGIPAAFLNSSLTAAQQREVLRRAGEGAYRLMYVTPERLLTESFLAFAGAQRIALLAVDEAHCVSQWGQDFRPNYLDIPAFVRALPRRPVLAAFTATATAQVGEDVVRLLGLADPCRIVTGFDRPNLYFDVRRERDKLGWLQDFLAARPDKSGIVYCATRKTVEQVCQALRAAGFAATRYHAGLDDRERRENQEDFSFDRATVMVATNAFGMGIDKSNVSFVIHYNMPKNIESYYQEAGRAGRDGAAAECVLLFSPADVMTAKFLIETGSDRDRLTEQAQEAVLVRDTIKLRQMENYCKARTCYRGLLLDYFGEAHAPTCGNCGVCRPEGERETGELVQEDITVPAQKILSCVRRVERQNRFGLGESVLVCILVGSKDKRVLEREYDQLSTYGILRGVKRDLVRDYIHALLNQGYLTQPPGEYEVLHTTPKADAVLFGGEQVIWAHRASPAPARRTGGKTAKASSAPLGLEQASSAPARQPDGMSAGDGDLLGRLQQLRTELARRRHVPVYVIFSNATLEELAARQPETMAQLLQIKGIGAQKAAKYGPAILETIARAQREQARPDAQREAPQPGSEPRKPGKAPRPKKQPAKEPQPILALRPDQLARFVPEQEGISITMFAQRLTELKDPDQPGELTGRWLSTRLVEAGYLEEYIGELGRPRRRPTPAGEAVGIRMLPRTNPKGETFTMLTLTTPAQHWLLAHLPELLPKDNP